MPRQHRATGNLHAWTMDSFKACNTAVASPDNPPVIVFTPPARAAVISNLDNPRPCKSLIKRFAKSDCATDTNIALIEMSNALSSKTI